MARINQERFNILTLVKGVLDLIFLIILALLYKNGCYILQLKEETDINPVKDSDETETINRFNTEND